MSPDAYSVYCADVGSVAKKRFGWGVALSAYGGVNEHDDITELAREVAQALGTGQKVALGFECPLFVPLPEDPRHLTSARDGEGSRPWCAGAGASALATGLTEVVWILSKIRLQLAAVVPAFLSWPRFQASPCGLFVWEAFVTGEAKTASHRRDAAVAVREFLRVSGDLEAANAIKAQGVFSLVGAALLRSGWTDDIGVLAASCIVIKPGKPGSSEARAG